MIFYFIIEEPLFANLQKKFHTLDKPIDIIKLMLKYVHAVKEKFRQFDRPLRGISAIHFGYR